ncbi:MAG: hypothetical protein L3J66_05420 [Bacteroidales bacterium]|nr:hypothetical protein [Bacteroidales bacterium]
MRFGLSNKKYQGLLLILLALSFVTVNFIGPSDNRRILIDGDGSGLYAYLPALVVFHSVDFTAVLNSEKQRRPPDYTAHYFHRINGTLTNKFTCGQALLQLPFFLLAYFLSLPSGLEADGYNVLFQYSVALAALFWVATGLIYFVKLAETYQVPGEKAWLIAFAGFLGTNLFFYTLVAPSHSHAYSFSIISISLYFVRKSFLTQKRNSILYAAFWLGITVLVRPVNVLVVAAFPFLASSFAQLRHLFTSKFKSLHFAGAALVFLLALSPQFIINLMQTGKVFIYGYQNEGFYFDRPELLNFLFSFRKGWFVYTPFMLLLLPALFFLFKQSKYKFFSFLGFLALLVYTFSSWWNWFYGDSFGMRPMIDYYSLFFLVILVMMVRLKSKLSFLAFNVFLLLTVFLNLFQSWQYAEGIIHPDAMNKKAYAHVFLRSGQSYKQAVGDTDESFYGVLQDAPFFETKNDLEKDIFGWSPNRLPVQVANSKAAKLTASAIYSPSFTYVIPDSVMGKRNIYIVFETKYLESKTNAAANALFVVDVKDTSQKTVFYKAFRMKRLPDKLTNQWRKGSIGFKIPDLTGNINSIKLYIWNKEKQEFLLDDMELKFYTYRQ